MRKYFYDKWDAAAFVNDHIKNLGPTLLLTMTITLEKSGGCYVSIATDESSEDTELQRAKFFSDTQLSI
nr:hypothetical protein [Bradyrhizobium erythrophlei]